MPASHRTHEELRAQAHLGLARRDGPLVRVELLVPYINRFRRENGILADGRRNELGVNENDLVGPSIARRIRTILAGEIEYTGLYKAESFLHALGYDGYVFQTDPALRAAFETPDTEVYAHAA